MFCFVCYTSAILVHKSLSKSDIVKHISHILFSVLAIIESFVRSSSNREQSNVVASAFYHSVLVQTSSEYRRHQILLNMEKFAARSAILSSPRRSRQLSFRAITPGSSVFTSICAFYRPFTFTVVTRCRTAPCAPASPN